jgi:methionyl aminopeptidase
VRIQRKPLKSRVLITEPQELEAMRKAGRLVALAHKAVQKLLRPGVTTRELGRAAERVIVEGGGRAAFKGYGGFPGAICASPNQVVVHGFPDDRPLKNGDIISVDIGAEIDKHFGDSAWTYAIGEVSPEVQRLLDVTEASLYAGIKRVRPGALVDDIAGAIQDVIEQAGFGVVREYEGHGIGRVLHGEPSMPNYRTGDRRTALKLGQGLAIEPMVTMGRYEVDTLDDDWTVVTHDGSWAAHFEHTMVVTANGPVITTSTKDL